MNANSVNVEWSYKYLVSSPTDLALAVTRGAITPAPDLEGSLVIENLVLATAGPVLDHRNPTLAQALVNLTPVQLTASPAQRAVQR